MTIKVPSDRRFRRIQQPKRARRRSSFRSNWVRGLWKVLSTLLLIYVAYVGVQILSRSSIFKINEVVLLGNKRLSSGEIMILLEDLKGESLPFVDLGMWRQRLEASTWLESVVIRRVLPSTIEVTVTERVPMGVGRIDGALYLVDRSGTVIDEFGPHYSDLDLPVIDGLVHGSSATGIAVDVWRADLAARLLDQLRYQRSDLAKLVSQIDVSDRDNAVVILEGEQARVHVGSNNFAERLQSFLELVPTLRERVPRMDYVDLRLDGRMYVRPAENTVFGKGLQTSLNEQSIRRGILGVGESQAEK